MARPLFVPMLLAAALAGCALTPGAPKDGELAVPADYKSWPKFLSAIQRPDAKQVREIYMNPAAAQASASTGFGNGTMFVMENYAALETTDGKLATDAQGKLIKADLLRVFVMGKNAGWGQEVAEPLRNGNWVYASYLGDGRTKGPEDTATCRACHLPLANKDFVHRYDEHFAARK
jgi:hemoglobin